MSNHPRGVVRPPSLRVRKTSPRLVQAPVTMDEIVRVLPSLTPGELATIKATASTLAAMHHAPPGASEHEHWFSQTVAGVLRHQYSLEMPPLHVLVKEQPEQAQAVQAMVQIVCDSAVRTGHPTPLCWRDYVTVAQVYCRLVCRHLTRTGEIVTWRSVVAAAEAFPSLLEQAFPGYGESQAMGRFVWQNERLATLTPVPVPQKRAGLTVGE